MILNRDNFRVTQIRPFAASSTEKEVEADDIPVEEQYSRKTPLEHVLLRPGMYVGANERQPSESHWVLENPPSPPTAENIRDSMDKLEISNTLECKLTKRECEIVPALIKVFDEILVNASDNRLRHPKSSTRIDVVIDPGAKGRDPLIRVFNDGRTIPVQEHEGEGMYLPEMLFGHLLTGSNFDDNVKRVTGGRHGYGAKLTNIFSKEFTVEVADSKRKKRYTQTWKNNMKVMGEPDIVPYKTGKDYTSISFVPDLERLTGQEGATSITGDEYALMCRRVIDVAGCSAGALNVSLNGLDVSMPSFEAYANLHRISSEDTPVAFKKINSRWSVAVGLSKSGLESVSFVNGMSTHRGGTHVNAITSQITEHMLQKIGKKSKSLSESITPRIVRQHLFVAINALIDNPTFDSQMKEQLSTNPSKFGSKYTLPKTFLDSLVKKKESGGPGIVEEIMRLVQSKEVKKVQTLGKKQSKKELLSIPKLEDAHQAGLKKRSECTLILTEGDSAKALAVAGLEVLKRELYGVWPLRGKFLNVKAATTAQLTKNAEVKALCSIMGLNFKKEYKTLEDRKSLRYGKIMLMTDQDTDGSHIKGLVINFFRHFWPDLLRPAIDGKGEDAPFLSSFVTPLLKATHGKEIHSFYSTVEFNKWKASLGDDSRKYRIKYYKGLGTSTPEEAKEYFRNSTQHIRPLYWKDDSDGDLIDKIFSKERADERRTWINETYDETASVYGDGDATQNEVSYRDFIDKELIHFSHYDNIRSVPSAIDGLKPSQRKVLYACFKRKLTKEMKVAQLSGYCAEHTAYHHGETSLQSTIIGMAQDYVGSNNMNLLRPSGQFGTRFVGGADAASPRYIYTELSPVTRILFPEADDRLLTYLEDDGQQIEPNFFCPIIPLLLVNGTRGIGTGWSTAIPHHDPRDIVDYLRAKLDGNSLPAINPFVRGFTGTFKESKTSGYQSIGRVSEKKKKRVLIEELPVGTWTDKYKSYLLKLREKGTISNFIEGHTTTKVSFDVEMTNEESLQELEKKGLEKAFKLTSNHAISNMHAFDHHGKMTKFDRPEDIIEEFFPVRLQLYEDRMSLLKSEAMYHALVMRNKARFIEKVMSREVDLVGGSISKAATVAKLATFGFDDELKLYEVRNDNALRHKMKIPAKVERDKDSRFDYLLSMPLMSLTEERINDLRKDAEEKDRELKNIQETSAEQLWHRDLDKLSPYLPKSEDQQ